MADDPKIPESERRKLEDLPPEVAIAIGPSPRRLKNPDTLLSSRPEKDEQRSRKILGQKIREEFEEPAIVIVGHALLIVFGVLVLSLLGWLIDKAHISDLAKEVLHAIDEYLMIFAFVILGFAFIIKIVTVVLGSIRR